MLVCAVWNEHTALEDEPNYVKALHRRATAYSKLGGLQELRGAICGMWLPHPSPSPCLEGLVGSCCPDLADYYLDMDLPT